ncbi:MAG: DUF1565 domain-containing protein [bacterium]
MNRHVLPITVFCILFLSTCLATAAAEYFVDVEKGDNRQGQGTKHAPWRNISVALDAKSNPSLSAGDIIYVASGVYDDTPGLCGLCEKFPLDLSYGVSLIGEASNRVIIDAKNCPASVIYSDQPVLIRKEGVTRAYRPWWDDPKNYRIVPLEIAGMTIKHTDHEGKGIELKYNGTVTIRKCRLIDNSQAIDSHVPTMITDCLISQDFKKESYPRSRDNYRPYNLDSGQWFSSFKKQYKEAQEKQANWLKDPMVVALRMMSGYSKLDGPKPDRICIYYPTGPTDKAFYTKLRGDGAIWSGDRITIVMLKDPVVDEDGIAAEETRVDLVKKNGIWEIVWAGARFRGGRAAFSGWTTELCP